MEDRTEFCAVYCKRLRSRRSCRASAQTLGSQDVQLGKVEIELFWYGMRDYIYQTEAKSKPDPEAIATSYKKLDLLRGLRERIENFYSETRPHKFEPLKPPNYDASEENWETLFNNLRQTEIDIVLQTPTHLFIGEAKYESFLDTEGRYVLVHQLIREYVMAKILVDLVQIDKLVVPFVVWDPSHPENLRNTVQAKFMVSQGWLKKENILSWRDIDKLANENSNPGA